MTVKHIILLGKNCSDFLNLKTKCCTFVSDVIKKIRSEKNITFEESDCNGNLPFRYNNSLCTRKSRSSNQRGYLFADVLDIISVIRVGDVFWMASTTMQMAPGVNVMVTELDLSILPPPRHGIGADLSTNIEYQQQFNPYTEGVPEKVMLAWTNRMLDFFKLFTKHQDKVTLVTMWGVSDGGSWKSNFRFADRRIIRCFSTVIINLNR